MRRGAAAVAAGVALGLAVVAWPVPDRDAALAAALARSRCGGEGAAVGGGGRAVLVSGLAPVHLPIEATAEAQRWFDQGIAQLYGFDYDEALVSFRAARRADPACVMCLWGEALAMGPYINSGPIAARTVASARRLTAMALRRAAPLSERDQTLIRALHARYAPGGRESGVHGHRFAQAMTDAAARWPTDDFVAVLAAEAIMDAQPWDYWQAGGRAPKGRAGEAVALVEQVLSRSPDHPQAIHLYIHLTEASAAPERAAPYAARLAAIAPAAPHMVHMPTHSWYRLGRFNEAIAGNRAAIAADEAYARATGADPKHYGYFRHHSHFLVSAAGQVGDRDTALAAAAGLEATITPDEAAKSLRLQGMLAAALTARAQFGSPAEVLALPAPDPRLHRVAAMWRALRADAYARHGDAAGVRAELDAAARAQAALGPDEVLQPLGALAAAVARGRLASVRGDHAEAVRKLSAAEAIENGFGYFEPPLWHLPTAATLGAAYLRAGDAARAETAFKRALKLRPGNAWALWGLAHAQAMAGHTEAADATRKQWRAAWRGAPDAIALDRI